jgi:hypothetical protein
MYEMCFSLEHMWREAVSSAQRAARTVRVEGRRTTRRAALGRTVWEFVRTYIMRFGWLDGWPGLHASALSAMATYFREALLWELSQPAGVRPVVVRDSWQGLKLFDPSGVADTAASESLQQSPVGDADFSSHQAARELRPAA